ncbi:hypothetical protein AHAS_Ahas15G0207100 [Arachis hypogaea]
MKRKTTGAADIKDKDFDGFGRSEEHILPYSYASTDDVSIFNHPQYITHNCIWMAGLSTTLATKFRKSPINATGAFLNAARANVDKLNGLKAELEEKNAKLESNLEKAKARATKAEAASKLAEEMKKRAERRATLTLMGSCLI